MFRPSDDSTVFPFLVPSNFFAVVSLRQAAEMLETIHRDRDTAVQCRALADEVEKALRQYAVVPHEQFGKIYAYEVDGYGNSYCVDDSNVPSLLALPYFGAVDAADPLYQATRRMLLSDANPYYSKGRAAEGPGGPHAGLDMIWPLGIILRAMTSSDDARDSALPGRRCNTRTPARGSCTRPFTRTTPEATLRDPGSPGPTRPLAS